MMISLTLLIILVFVEWTLYQRKHIQNTRSILLFRTVFLAFWIFLYSFSAFGFGLRYLPIIIAQIILLFSDTLKFLITKRMKKPNLVFLIILLLFALIPSWLFPPYQPLETTGSYPIVEKTQILMNTESNRDIRIRMWYPNISDSNQSLPLFIYSHGGISVDTSNESLARELASHGYRVVSVNHPGQSIVTKDANGKSIWIDMDFLDEITKENATESPENSFALYQKWMGIRSQDLHLVIDQLKIMHPNTSQIFASGHSLGGSAALCIGREREGITAVIALESPFMCDITGVSDQIFIFDSTPYPIFVLNIYTESAYPNLHTWPQYKQNAHYLDSSSSHITNIYLPNTYHFSITDLSLTSPFFHRLLNGASSKSSAEKTLTLLNQHVLEFLLEASE